MVMTCMTRMCAPAKAWRAYLNRSAAAVFFGRFVQGAPSPQPEIFGARAERDVLRRRQLSPNPQAGGEDRRPKSRRCKKKTRKKKVSESKKG